MVRLDRITNAVKEIHRDESGQAMVESAIMFPLYIAVICVLIETAVLANAYFVTEYAAYCAARASVVHAGSIEKMHVAASVALSPITQTSLLQTRLDVGNPMLNSYSTLFAASAQAFLQFNEGVSIAEMIARDVVMGGWYFLRRDQDETITHNDGSVATIADEYKSINQVYSMDLNPASDGGAGAAGLPTYTHRFAPFPGKETSAPVPIHDQYGDSKKKSGYRYTTYTSEPTVKRMRMRVQVSHFHPFMFKFIPQLLSFVSRPLSGTGNFKINMGVDVVIGGGPGADDDGFDLEKLSPVLMGGVIVRGFCLMRMHTNLIEENIDEDEHKRIHKGFPPNPF
jgi:hypothetical protein